MIQIQKTPDTGSVVNDTVSLSMYYNPDRWASIEEMKDSDKPEKIKFNLTDKGLVGLTNRNDCYFCSFNKVIPRIK